MDILSFTATKSSLFLLQCHYRLPLESRCEHSMFVQVHRASLRAPVASDRGRSPIQPSLRPLSRDASSKSARDNSNTLYKSCDIRPDYLTPSARCFILRLCWSQVGGQEAGIFMSLPQEVRLRTAHCGRVVSLLLVEQVAARIEGIDLAGVRRLNGSWRGEADVLAFGTSLPCSCSFGCNLRPPQQIQHLLLS